jgi:hypothetical protein
MKRKFGLNKHGKSEKQKAVRKLDTALSLLVRSQYKQCCTCGRMGELDCGHFRRRECMATRFDYRNVAGQCKKDNRFNGGLPYEFGIFIDRTWGEGTAKELFNLSNEIWQWEVSELDQLTSAAKHSWLAYTSLYDELAAKRK